MADDISKEYFKWVCESVCGKKYNKHISYNKLLTRLHNIEFTYSIPGDKNRAEDGISLRYHFLCDHLKLDNATDCLGGPCSVFEMMAALSIRCEDTIMDDPSVGNRTGQWFWGMIVSLGLGSMIDARFDEKFVNDAITKFLNREYETNGKGGLFTVPNCDIDMRTATIWRQLCRYLQDVN